MKRLLSLVAFFATLQASAQQVNPVPDYVFRNQMSVGRNAVTDTAAYFSIGPRYGATKGFMPPIVGDTATFSSGKRNGLLIFSVQKNKFLYWDSVRVQWSDMAGSSGAYIVAGDTSAMLAPYLRKADTTSMLTAYLRKGDTASMLSPYYRSAAASAALALKVNISDTSSMLGNYVRHAGYGLTKSGQSFLIDTLNIATRAWRQKGIDSVVSLIPAAGVGGSGTTNYVPKFTAGSTIGNSQIQDNGSGVGIGVNPDSNLKLYVRPNSTTGTAIYSDNGANSGFVVKYNAAITNIGNDFNAPLALFTNNTERLRIFANGRVFIGASPTDAGYQLDVNGTLRSVNGANFATTSGNVGIGTASPTTKMHIVGSATTLGVLRIENSQNRNDVNHGTINIVNTKSYALGNDMGIMFSAYRSDNTEIDPRASIAALVASSFGAHLTFSTRSGPGTSSEKMRITEDGELLINTTTDAGDYKLQVSGSSRLYHPTANIGGVLTSFNGNSENYYDADLHTFRFGNGGGPAMVIRSNAEVAINNPADAGDYKLQVSGNIYNTGSAVLAATSGNVGIGTASPAYKFHTLTSDATIAAFRNSGAANGQILIGNTAGDLSIRTLSTGDSYIFSDAGKYLDFGSNASFRMRLTSDGELLVSTTTDAGDYKLQVVGNARIGTGKLDIASNTTFGLGVARSGTSEVAGQIYNSNGILYFGAESSTGGGIFSGSSAYAAVIGSGANYPLQFATNNATRATITSSGKFIVGATSEYFFSSKMEVNGGMAIRNTPTDGTLLLDSTALNLYGITNRVGFNMNNGKLTGSNASPAFTIFDWTWNTTANVNLVDISLVNTASGASSNYFRISDGTNEFRVTKEAEVVTAAPTGGSIRKWKLGEAATVSPTSPNRTIRVEIDGTVYYLHAKTTND